MYHRGAFWPKVQNTVRGHFLTPKRSNISHDFDWHFEIWLWTKQKENGISHIQMWDNNGRDALWVMEGGNPIGMFVPEDAKSGVNILGLELEEESMDDDWLNTKNLSNREWKTEGKTNKMNKNYSRIFSTVINSKSPNPELSPESTSITVLSCALCCERIMELKSEADKC